MINRHSKTGYFILEGLNAFATSFYFYYLFFLMQRQFGFGNLGNLSLAALNGLIYTFMAWIAGRLGQRFGYVKALGVGFTVMIAALVAGLFLNSAAGQICVLVIWTIGICFTWPNLEALVSEGENPMGLQQKIGIYNLVWAGFSALAYFSGGLIIERFGLRSLFWLPAILHLVQIVLLIGLRSPAGPAATVVESHPTSGPLPMNPRPISRARAFLQMAWVANPFAYVAINTVVAVVPGLARKLDLSPAMAGFFCSIWFFARLLTFLWLWLWTGWHYRLRWLLGSYVLLIASFAAILLIPKLLVIAAAQITFGLALGLIYYSSLFYSMDVGEAKGEHGGVHEAAIGAGIFAGPAIGAAAAHFLPAHPNSSAVAVSIALCGGLLGLVRMAIKHR